jgi:hypothetical protein
MGLHKAVGANRRRHYVRLEAELHRGKSLAFIEIPGLDVSCSRHSHLGALMLLVNAEHRMVADG